MVSRVVHVSLISLSLALASSRLGGLLWRVCHAHVGGDRRWPCGHNGHAAAPERLRGSRTAPLPRHNF
jgi:hypothetical protein